MATMPGDLDSMRAELARFTYRPGWKLTLRTGSAGQPLLVATYRAEDARRPGHTVNLRAHRSLPWTSDPDELGRTLLAALDSMEQHETREHLRRDGVLFDDPHADPSRWQCEQCGVTGPPKTAVGEWVCDLCHTTYALTAAPKLETEA